MGSDAEISSIYEIAKDWLPIEHSIANLNRFNLVANFTRGNSIGDIGCDSGIFCRYLKVCLKLNVLYTIDITQSQRFKPTPGVNHLYFDITECNDYPSTDTLFCMEVLEHIDPNNVPAVIDTIRKKSARRIFSLPWKEKFPLYMEGKKGGHTQQFDEEKVNLLFPNAVGALYNHWIIIIEDDDFKIEKFKILTVSQIKKFVTNEKN